MGLRSGTVSIWSVQNHCVVFSPKEKKKIRAESTNNLVMPTEGEQKVKNPRQTNSPQISDQAYSQQTREAAYLLSLRQFSFSPNELVLQLVLVKKHIGCSVKESQLEHKGSGKREKKKKCMLKMTCH